MLAGRGGFASTVSKLTNARNASTQPKRLGATKACAHRTANRYAARVGMGSSPLFVRGAVVAHIDVAFVSDVTNSAKYCVT